MRKILRFIFYASPLLLAGGCDTKEDTYFVGERPSDSDILKVSSPDLTFKPEGEAQDIQVTSIASWEASVVDDNTGKFSLSPTSGKGNGVVTITAKPNASSGEYKATMQIRPINFTSNPLSVSLRQYNMILRIGNSPSPIIKPEEGDTVNMSIISSIDWKLEPIPHDNGIIGDTDWLEVNPGLSGSGSDGAAPQNITFRWKPNYSQDQRKIQFQLKPASDIKFNEELPYFTLTQASGTLPADVSCQVQVYDIVNASISLDYSSRSSVKDCGVILYKNQNGSEQLVDTIRSSKSNDEYALVGSYSLSYGALEENSTFRVKPFCVNKVGKTIGPVQEFSTGIKPEKMRYQGLSIIDGDKGGITVESDETSAIVSVLVHSDVTPLGNNRIAGAVMNFNGISVNGTASTSGESTWKYVFKTSDSGLKLTPKTEYEYTIVITGVNLPESQGYVEKNQVTLTGKFKTKGLIPNEDNNDKPL